MAVRLAVTADLATAGTLLKAVESELLADWGKLAWNQSLPTGAASWVSAVRNRYLVTVSMDNASVIRGFQLSDNRTATLDNGWHQILVVTDKTLTLANRLVHYAALLKDVASRNPATFVYGDVKVNGNLDTFLATKGGTRSPIVFEPDPTDPLGVRQVATVVRYRFPSATLVANL